MNCVTKNRTCYSAPPHDATSRKKESADLVTNVWNAIFYSNCCKLRCVQNTMTYKTMY